MRHCPQLTPAIPTDEYWFVFPDGQIKKYWPNGQPLKESRFFTYLFDYNNIDVYEKLFDDSKAGFEASVEYLHLPGVAERIKTVYDDLKFIVMLRDPVDRAWSQYWHEVNFNRGETLPFEDAILRDIKTVEDYYFRAYLKTGHYAEHLKRWFELFGRDSFFIIQSEQFYRDPDYWFKATQCFLGLDPIIELIDYSTFGITSQYPEMAAGTRALLQKYFDRHNKKLYKLLEGEA